MIFVDALTALGMTKLSLGMSVVRKDFLLFINMVFSRRCLRRKMLLCGAGGGYTGGIGDKRWFFSLYIGNI